MTQGDPITVLQYLEVVTEKKRDALSQDNRQQAQVAAGEIPSDYKKNALECN